MDRETYEITTPIDKKKIVLKRWLTGGEIREIRNEYVKAAAMRGGDITKPSPEVINAGDDKLIELIVVSVDGKTENIVQEILSLKSIDYDFVMSELNRVYRGDFFMQDDKRAEGSTD